MTITTIKPEVGMMSLVGVGESSWPDAPLSFGNYFSFAGGIDRSRIDLYSGPKCVNMWAENLMALASGLALDEIEIALFENRVVCPSGDGKWVEPSFAFITDSRVPKSWLIPQSHYSDTPHPGLCFTGCMWVSKETLNEIVAFSKNFYTQS